jgi:hypothetical protein
MVLGRDLSYETEGKYCSAGIEVGRQLTMQHNIFGGFDTV